MTPLLAVEELTVTVSRRGSGREASSTLEVVRDVSFTLERGEQVALVGESGAGKSLTALALIGLLPPGARARGRAFFDGEELLEASSQRRRRVRGRGIGMVFQEPTTALDPSYSIGWQLAEVLRAHGKAGSRRQAREGAAQLLERVAMPDPLRRLRAYPHQLSGGQCQRVVLALALAGEPRLLIADEPTTALDVTVQAEILDLLARLRAELDLSVLLVTHDLGIVAQSCDRAMVMYAGELVEVAATAELFAAPAHPYTRSLLAASPRLGDPARALRSIAGLVPDPGALPAGCPYHPRCEEVLEPCRSRPPALLPLAAGSGGATRRVRCWLHHEAPRAVGGGG